MKKEQAIQLWDELYQNHETAFDYAAHEMRREDYQNNDRGFGWDVDIKQPLYLGGNSQNGNLVITSLLTMGIRNGRTSFNIGKLSFEVRKGKKYGTFCIYDTTEKSNPVSMDPSKDNQDPYLNNHRRNISLGIAEEQEEKPVFDPTANINQDPDYSGFVIEEKDQDEEESDESQEASESSEETNAFASETETIAEETETVSEKPVETQNTENDEEEEIVIPFSKSFFTIEKEPEEETLPEVSTEETVQAEPEVEKPEEVLTEEVKTEDIPSAEEKPVEQETTEETGYDQEIEDFLNFGNHGIKPVSVVINLLNSNGLRPQEEDNPVIFEESSNPIEASVIINNESNVFVTEPTSVNNDWVLPEYQEEKPTISETEVFEEKKAEESPVAESKREETVVSLNETVDASVNQQELNSLKSQLEDVLSMNHSLNEEIQTEKNEKDNLQMQVTLLSEENASLKNSLNINAIDLADIKSKSESLSKDLEALNASLKEEKELNETLKVENGKIKLNFDSLKFREAEFARTELMKEHLIADKENAENQALKLTADLESETNKNNVLETENAQLKHYAYGLEDLEKEKARLIFGLSKSCNENKIKAELVQGAYDDLGQEKAASEAELQQQISSLQLEADSYNQMAEFYKNDGKEEFYDDFCQYLADNNIKISYDALKNAEKEHSDWFKKYSLSQSDRENDPDFIKAKDFFVSQFGEEIYETTDFAGREIRLDCYENHHSQYGWDIKAIDETKPLTGDNVILANYKSMADITADKPFMSNGHEFTFTETDKGRQLISKDFITNPYDFNKSIKVITDNPDAKEKLIYIFVKFTGVASSTPDPILLNEFYAFVERSFVRCSPLSSLAIRSGKDYLFLTYDGTNPNAVKEAMHYAILLNSYRSEFKKRGSFNAIIILDSVMARVRQRSLDFDKLTSETKDIEMMAIKQELNSFAVIDTMINRTIHVGPQLIDSLGLNKAELAESRLGQGNFALTYNFRAKYYECRYIYRIIDK
ncbi:MAG: hypothetical protein WCR67_01810 [Bacilli bacterium]